MFLVPNDLKRNQKIRVRLATEDGNTYLYFPYLQHKSGPGYWVDGQEQAKKYEKMEWDPKVFFMMPIIFFCIIAFLIAPNNPFYWGAALVAGAWAGKGFLNIVNERMKQVEATLKKAAYQLTEQRYWQEYGVQISWFGYTSRMLFFFVLCAGLFHASVIVGTIKTVSYTVLTSGMVIALVAVTYTSGMKLIKSLRGRWQAKRRDIDPGDMEGLETA